MFINSGSRTPGARALAQTRTGFVQDPRGRLRPWPVAKRLEWQQRGVAVTRQRSLVASRRAVRSPVISAYKLVKKRLDSSTRGTTGTYQEQTEKIIVLPGLAILAPPRVYALCLGTGGTALFTALALITECPPPIKGRGRRAPRSPVAMDPERQPLLNPVAPGLRCRTYRALTYEEVRAARDDGSWKCGRCLILTLFWCMIVACLSMAVSLLIVGQDCTKFHQDQPTVPPTHLNFAPLISRSIAAKENELAT
ncbi:hypothetical protein EVAR_10684_1 [Eumeta japonica]|uniref:Uncharacterized protein n=1 Tax=Eumeta variegata TaxID=151549 RepID=A0A4C1U8B7_EUMVA|nr:hypothetical protein EVAR_10684_1 [Eumeta japonica]